MSAIGIDTGYGYTKVCKGDRAVVFPSQSGPAVRRHDSGINVRSVDYHLLKPLDYFVGDLAVQQMVGGIDLSSGWFMSEQYQALVFTALAAVTHTFNTSYTLVTGLPINHLHLAPALRDLLANRYQVQLNGGSNLKTVNVEQVKVIAQGIGALLGTVIDDGGVVVDPEQVKRGRGGVFDIGSRTTGLVSVEGIHEVGMETRSLAVGAWKVEQDVRRAIEERLPGWGERVGPHELMQGIRERKVYDYDQPVDITDIVEDALNVAARDIISAATALWGDGRHLRRIIVCGGGAHLFYSHIKTQFPHAQVIDGDPQFANVIGYYRLAQFLARHRR